MNTEKKETIESYFRTMGDISGELRILSKTAISAPASDIKKEILEEEISDMISIIKRIETMREVIIKYYLKEIKNE